MVKVKPLLKNANTVWPQKQTSAMLNLSMFLHYRNISNQVAFIKPSLFFKFKNIKP